MAEEEVDTEEREVHPAHICRTRMAASAVVLLITGHVTVLNNINSIHRAPHIAREAEDPTEGDLLELDQAAKAHLHLGNNPVSTARGAQEPRDQWPKQEP